MHKKTYVVTFTTKADSDSGLGSFEMALKALVHVHGSWKKSYSVELSEIPSMGHEPVIKVLKEGGVPVKGVPKEDLQIDRILEAYNKKLG
jgi:hypothetical protein